MKKLLTFIILFTLVLSGCKQKEEKLIVITSSGYEPYEMVDKDGNLTGFDIELFEALAEIAGYQIKWDDIAFDGIIASLQTNQADAAIAGITPTSSRKESVDFSDVYYDSQSGLTNYLVIKSDSLITGENDLSGLIVGAQLGTIQAEIIDEMKGNYSFTTDLRNTNTQIIQEIKAGRIDALVVESAVADSIIASESSFIKVPLTIDTDSVTGNAIAFPKGSKYTAIFNDALKKYKESGEYQNLVTKWFDN